MDLRPKLTEPQAALLGTACCFDLYAIGSDELPIGRQLQRKGMAELSRIPGNPSARWIAVTPLGRWRALGGPKPRAVGSAP